MLSGCAAATLRSDGGAIDARTFTPGPVDPACATAGCLRAVTKIGDYSLATLQSLVQPGATVDNGYSVFTIEFLTDGNTARATVTIPLAIEVPANGWHVVANNHGTTGIGDPCAVAGTLAGAGLSGLFGAHGLIGLAVDYPGLGTPGVHPYLVARSEGRASLDALRATRQLAAVQQVRLSGRYAITGLSQGGHATLAAATERPGYALDLDIRAYAVSGPASVWEEHWRAGIGFDGPHVTFHAMLIYAWANHYGFSGPSLWTSATAAKIDRVMADDCYVSTPSIGDELGSSRAQIFSPALLAAYQSGSWGAFGAVHGWFESNRIRSFPQTAPLKVYQGTADDTVPEYATSQLVAALRDGGVTVDYELVPGGGHIDVAFGFLAYPQRRTAESLAWLKMQLDR